MNRHAPQDFNPEISANAASNPSREGGKGFIERADDAYYNMRWQTRARPLTGYEDALSAALEIIFASGAQELGAIVAGLNASDVAPPEGGVWTADIFTATMARLAAPHDATPHAQGET